MRAEGSILFAGGGTGGHLYPGLAIARSVQRIRPDIRCFFVGAERGVERDVLPTSGFRYALLDLHPLYRTRVWNNARTLMGLISAWRRLGDIVREERPSLIVGTGGYASGAALAYGVAHGIPIVEQTGDSLPSLTARMFSRWAREIYLSFPESATHLRVKSRSVLVDTGAPIEPPPEPRPARAAALAAWGFPPDAIAVLVYGASQGSLAINNATRDWIQAGLPPRVHVIWSTGRKTYDDFAGLESDRVKVRPYLSPIGDAYAATTIAVARAGTMTIAELMAWNIPAVLIPLPSAAANHQEKNAIAVERDGAGVHLPQSRLSGGRLGETIRSLLDDPGRLATLSASTRRRARPHAAQEIARRIVDLLAALP